MTDQELANPIPTDEDQLPDLTVHISMQNYPQLCQIAWHIKDGFELTQAEAFALHESNRRYLDLNQMPAHGLKLLKALECAALRGAYAI
jgi:hypothetical protein